jgi:hypothetical protein
MVPFALVLSITHTSTCSSHTQESTCTPLPHARAHTHTAAGRRLQASSDSAPCQLSVCPCTSALGSGVGGRHLVAAAVIAVHQALSPQRSLGNLLRRRHPPYLPPPPQCDRGSLVWPWFFLRPDPRGARGYDGSHGSNNPSYRGARRSVMPTLARAAHPPAPSP